LIVVDSAGWIELFLGGPLASTYRAYVDAGQTILTPTIVLYEVCKVLLRELPQADAAKAIAALENQTTVVPLDAYLAVSAAHVSGQHGLAMADAIVYATAQVYGAVVVTSDEHFSGLPGVDYHPKPQATP